jgi:hypothetical protein
VSDSTTVYSITGGHLSASIEEEEEEGAADSASSDLSAALLSKTAEWVGTRRRRLLHSTGQMDTSREMLDERTMMVEITARGEDGKEVTARTRFERVQQGEEAGCSREGDGQTDSRT